MRTLFFWHFALISLLLSLTVTYAQQRSPNWPDGMRWRMVGPFRGGRARAVAGGGRPPNGVYTGAVDGGVWESTAYCRTWGTLFVAHPTQPIRPVPVDF